MIGSVSKSVAVVAAAAVVGGIGNMVAVDTHPDSSLRADQEDVEEIMFFDVLQVASHCC